MPTRRSPDAAMSAFELLALCRVSDGMSEVIEVTHRELLVRMGLAKVNSGGVLEAIEDGMRRLEAETQRDAR